MKILNLNNLLIKDYYICKYNKNFWGKQQSYNIYSYCKKNNCVIINLINLFLNIKKIIFISNIISLNNGITTVCFLYNELLLKRLHVNIRNFYFVFIDKYYGFFSNFFMFLKNFKKINTFKITNYNSFRLPSLILMNKNSWKNYDSFFSSLIRLRILSIKSGLFLQNDIYAGYNILLENSHKIYLILKYIYIINGEFIKKW